MNSAQQWGNTYPTGLTDDSRRFVLFSKNTPIHVCVYRHIPTSILPYMDLSTFLTLHAPLHFFSFFNGRTGEWSLHQKQIRGLPSVSISSSESNPGDRMKDTELDGFLSQAFPPQNSYTYKETCAQHQKHSLIKTAKPAIQACTILRLMSSWQQWSNSCFIKEIVREVNWRQEGEAGGEAREKTTVPFLCGIGATWQKTATSEWKWPLQELHPRSHYMQAILSRKARAAGQNKHPRHKTCILRRHVNVQTVGCGGSGLWDHRLGIKD